MTNPERLEWIERHQYRLAPDGMDGWLVRSPLRQFGMRQGYRRYGAHRLHEAIDAAIADYAAARPLPEKGP